MKVLLYIGLFSSLLMSQACSDRAEEPVVEVSLPKEAPTPFDSPEKLISFIDNSKNGFVKSKTIGQITYSAILKPTDYLLARKRLEENNPNLNKEDFEDLQYFDLRINIDDFHKEFIKYDLESIAEYQERVSYCAFAMQQDILLLDGKDTLNCVLYHYERAFDVVPYGHFILGFEPNGGKLVNSKTLVFNDRLFKNGLIKFTFSPKLLVNEPVLL